MTKYQITRLQEGNKGFGIVNAKNEYYSEGHFDGLEIDNFTFYKESATLMSITDAHKLAYKLNNK